MNQLTKYINTPLVSLSRFDHEQTIPHYDPKEEVTRSWSVNFIEHGSFSLSVGKRCHQMSSGQLFVTHPGMIFRCRHREEFPEDVCFSVDYKSDLLAEEDNDRWPRRDRPTCVLKLNNRLSYLHLLLRDLCAGSRDQLAAESYSMELLSAIIEQRKTEPQRLYGRRQLTWYTERIEAARHLMDTHFSDAHTLASLARFTGMSPFHFARVFRELTGTPPHQHLMNVRLTKASKLLREGAGVTDTCFASGFSNLSHFIRIFQRKFGVSPSRFPRMRNTAA